MKISSSQKKNPKKERKYKQNVLKFNYNLESELIQLKTELETKTYQPGKYKTFTIIERKPRMISAAPYRDRIIHHALCNIPHQELKKSVVASAPILSKLPELGRILIFAFIL